MCWISSGVFGTTAMMVLSFPFALRGLGLPPEVAAPLPEIHPRLAAGRVWRLQLASFAVRRSHFYVATAAIRSAIVTVWSQHWPHASIAFNATHASAPPSGCLARQGRVEAGDAWRSQPP